MNYPYYNQNQSSQVGFMSVRGKDIAINYPIAPGNTIFFKDEVAPFIYVKTMGYSPLDKPTLDTYKREDLVAAPVPEKNHVEKDNPAINKLQDEITMIIEDIEVIKKRLNTRPKRKEPENDEQ